MIKQVEFGGEHIIPLCNGAALVASKSEWGVWHVVKNGRCDCKGFAARGTCRHLRTVTAMNAPKVETPTSATSRDGLFLPERPVSPSRPVPTFEQFFGIVA